MSWPRNTREVAEAYFSIPFSTKTASYTPVLEDRGTLIEMNVETDNEFTVPLSSSVPFPISTCIHVCQMGEGQTAIVAEGGVALRTASTLTTRTRYSTVSLRKRDTEEWVLSGDLSP